MKYKPCCEKRCLVHGCKTREQGACYCICRMHDQISHLESIMSGRTLYDGVGFQYIPDDDFRNQIFSKWSDAKKEMFRIFKEIQAPELIEKYKNKLKEYEM